MSIPERRTYPRYAVQLHALLNATIESGSQEWPALVTDIARGGMFLVSNTPLWVGAASKARILLDPPLELDCIVRRVLPNWGIGVMFDSLPDATAARLEELLAKLAGAMKSL